MKRILCYGDSITWGADPEGGTRFDEATRYPRVLAALLGAEYDVVEEGCPGRTTVYDTGVDHYVNGRTYLYPCLESHQPLDLIVLMLGTNDIANGARKNAYYAAAGVQRLVQEIRRWCMDRNQRMMDIVIVSPPIVSPVLKPDLDQVFDTPYAHDQSLQFKKYYQAVATQCGCAFLASEEYAVAGTDGVHITAESHKNLAQALAALIKEQLENRFEEEES